MNIQISDISRKETLRYLGVINESSLDLETSQAVDLSISLLKETAHPQYMYRLFSFQKQLYKGHEAIHLDGTNLYLTGKDIQELLKDCGKCILLAATLGSGVDQMIRKAQRLDMAKAVIYNACANVAIESVCDDICKSLREELNNSNQTASQRSLTELSDQSQLTKQVYLTDRYSPGYGDLPLELQTSLTQVLETGKRIGLTVTDTCMMIPEKSVTAIIGISDKPQHHREGCDSCSNAATCPYRRQGGHSHD